MAPMSRGKGRLAPKAGKRKVDRRTLEAGNRHRWEPFTQRVAQLKIDPIRRSRQSNTLETKDSSFFQTVLEEWKDKNMSADFSDFLRDVQPVSQSLPQILHHQEQIAESLLKYLNKGAALSLEPLLSLTTHFAHDLGSRFEPYFGNIVASICAIASSHENVDVIEWSFNCLAWLFKYLSRLLIPDLRPLYDVLAPLLGKSRQKHYVTRFAGEAMSFLVRKAGAVYEKNQNPLKLLIDHIFLDFESLEASRDVDQYREGVIVLFAESMKGVQSGVTPSGPAIFETLLARLLTNSANSNTSPSNVQQILEGIMINVMHHTDANSFHGLQQIILESINTSEATFDLLKLEYAARLLFVISSTRNGSCVNNWEPVVDKLIGCVQVIENSTFDIGSSITSATLNALAVILMSAPLSVSERYIKSLRCISEGEKWKNHFLENCIYASNLDPLKFQNIFIPFLQSFIELRWREQKAELCLLLPEIFPITTQSTWKISIPVSWQQQMLLEIQAIRDRMKANDQKISSLSLAMCSQYMDFIKWKAFTAEMQARLVEEATSIAVYSFSNAGHIENLSLAAFGLGKAFDIAIDYGKIEDISKVVWENLKMLPSRAFRSSHFLHSLSSFIRISCPKSKTQSLKSIYPLILDNLTSASHLLRLRTLQIVQQIEKSVKEHDPDIINLALTIENTNFDLENSRALNMHMRNLALKYETSTIDPWLKTAVPYYFFGLLHVQLTPIWEEACNSLKSMSKVEGTDEVVLQRAFEWINQDLGQETEAPITTNEEPNYFRASHFECSHVLKLQNLAERAALKVASASEELDEGFKSEFAPYLSLSQMDRALGLRVLSMIPQLAEKRSRQLVPFLLNWVRDDTATITENYSQENHNRDDSKIIEARWSRKDQKALLGLFAQFTNPMVLYRSMDVQAALLTLLTNGDLEIQKLALKALFTWKSPSIRPYQENLLNILDDSRFREEVSVFLDAEEGVHSIQEEHRAQLMPVLLRLLYGRLITRSGSTNAHGGQEVKRKAVLLALSRFREADLDIFISIALGPLDKCIITVDGQSNEDISCKDPISTRRQMGVLRMIQDIFATIANLLSPFSERLIHSILFCAKSASDGLKMKMNQIENPTESRESNTLLKSVRQEAMACINLLFKTFRTTDWGPYVSLLMTSVINPRLPNLASENAQSVSNLLKLFSTWSESINTVQILFDQNTMLLNNLSICLSSPNTRDDVKIFIMTSIVGNISDLANDQDVSNAKYQLVQQHVRQKLHEKVASSFLSSVSLVLHHSQSQDLIEACLSTVLGLAPFVTEPNETEKLLESTVYLLNQPTRKVSPRLKGEILKVIEGLIPESASEGLTRNLNAILEATEPLFAFFRDNPNRRKLVQVLQKCSKVDTRLEKVAALCDKLNSFSSTSLGVPNFEQRQDAFRFINEENTSSLTIEDWRPIIFNMLFFIRDNDEYVIRTSASLCLKRFVHAASQHSQYSKELRAFAENVLLPALQKGLSNSSELVRVEYVTILAEIINHKWIAIKDMEVLTGPDEESSFFNNILHIQVHRRIRALRRLSTDSQGISSWNVFRFCLPLVEVFLSDSDEESANVIAEATNTIGILSECLEWSRFRSLLQKRINEASKFDSKMRIKALGAVVESLARAHALKKNSPELLETNSTLAKSLPDLTDMASNISKTILPKLMEFVHFKDDSSVNLRVLVAPVVVQLIMMLPAEEVSQKLPPLLMDICNILKSRAQDARDSARKTLAEISAIIGPHYFGFIIKQLRSSLQRGSHLHVLSYTIHSLLISVSPGFENGTIDYCLDNIMAIIMNDIFGATGMEKDAQDYISKMREVRKKNLSYDSVELAATITSLSHVSTLVRPLKEQILKPKAKLDKIDEVFRRIKEGLRRNSAANDRKFLTMCYELLVEAYGVDENKNLLAIVSFHKLASFTFEVLRRVLDKYEDLKTPENMAGFLPIVEISLNQNDEEVQMSAFRFLSSIIKVPLDGLDNKASVYIHQAKTIIEDSSSTNTALAQTALRLIASIIRERPNAPIPRDQFEVDLAYLLTKILPDLREPGRQGERDRQVAAFNLLKAVLGREFLLKEVYDVMDTVREVMITNAEPPIPDLARNVYSRFVVDYFPSGGKGLAKQVDFLVSNLQYPNAKGRISVMEVIHFLLSKKDAESVQPLLTSFFLPMVLLLLTDESKECRQSANLITRKILERANKEQTKLFGSQLRTWLEPNMEILWQRAALQCWTISLDVQKPDVNEIQLLYTHVASIIEDKNEPLPRMEKLVFDAITLSQKLCEIHPDLMFSSKTKPFWRAIALRLGDDSPAVVEASVKLVSMMLNDLAKSVSAESGRGLEKDLKMPLRSINGYCLDVKQATQLVESSLTALTNATEEPVTFQIIQNIAFIGRCCQGSTNDLMVLQKIFAGCGTMIRKETDESTLQARISALKLVAALCTLLPADSIQPSLEEILKPLYNLSDVSIPKPAFADPKVKAMQDDLINAANELLSQLHTKFGASEFVNQMQQIQKEVRERREGRRTKRRIDAVVAPEKAGREKQRRNLVKRVKRKEKNSMAAGMRRGW